MTRHVGRVGPHAPTPEAAIVEEVGVAVIDGNGTREVVHGVGILAHTVVRDPTVVKRVCVAWLHLQRC